MNTWKLQPRILKETLRGNKTKCSFKLGFSSNYSSWYNKFAVCISHGYISRDIRTAHRICSRGPAFRIANSTLVKCTTTLIRTSRSRRRSLTLICNSKTHSVRDYNYSEVYDSVRLSSHSVAKVISCSQPLL